jgi:hypothetical protein
MIVKQQLIAEIETIDNLTTLSKLFKILQLVKQNIQIQLMKYSNCATASASLSGG